LDPVIARFADAVAADLNGNAFCMPFEAQRRWLVVLDRDKVEKKLHVSVVPVALVEEAAGRGMVQQDFTLQIGVQRGVDPSKTADIDQMVLLVQEICDYLRFSDIADCGWIGTQISQLFLPEHLQTKNLFTSVMTFTFRTFRQ
jgi:hypothetical protein